jgi:hypothetical protein
MTIPKVPFLAAFIILLCLPACSPSWVTGPFSTYLKEKTGLEMKVEKFSFGLSPFHLESTGIQLSLKKAPASWEAKIRDLRIDLGWTISWEDLPWPKFFIKKVSINQPSFTIRQPTTAKGADWTTWLRQCPAIKQLEVNDLKGRLEIGTGRFQLAPGTQVSASFSPDQGGKLDYRIKSLQGRWSSKKINFQAGSEGSIELSGIQDQPKWTGSIILSQAKLSSEMGKVSDLSGAFKVLYHDSLWEISAISATVHDLSWQDRDLSFQGQGTINLSGSLKMNKKEILFPGVSLKLADLDFDFKQKDRWIRGRAEGQAQLSGPYSRPVLKGRLATRQTDFYLHPVSTQGMETEILVQGRFPSLSFPVVKAKSDQTTYHLPGGVLSIINPETRFSGLLGERRGQVDLKDIWFKTANWGTWWGYLHFNPSLGPAPSGKVRTEGFPLPRFINLFYSKANEPFPEEIPCQGTLEWSRDSGRSPFVFQVSIAPAPFSFHLPASDWQGEGIKTRIDIQGKWFSEIQKVHWDLSQTLFGGRLLRPPWVFGFDHRPLKARLEGTVEAGGQIGCLKGSLVVSYDPLGIVTVSGEYPFGTTPDSYSGTIEIQDLPVEKAYPHLIGHPLSSTHPFLERVSPQGLLNARLMVSKKGKAYEIGGRLAGSEMILNTQQPAFSLQGVSLDLPFFLAIPEVEPGKGLFSESGFIQMNSLSGLQRVERRFYFPILAKTNQFEVVDRIEVPLWGGWASINALKLTSPLGDFKITTDLSLKDLDLNQLLKNQGIPGTLNGQLGPILINQEKVQIEGTIEASIFEGTVEGKNLALLDPFSSGRCLQGDLYYSHLNLEPITKLFSFGKITGFVQGEMIGLSICYNRPERFQLFIRTQEIPGVPKSIHIKAIENISLLGTGWGELDILRQGLNSWITSYDYQEIGLACSLKEDRFRINGTIVEGGVEYLVRKPSLFGIDIVNKNPDNEISFSDILERIRRIKESQQEGKGNENK